MQARLALVLALVCVVMSGCGDLKPETEIYTKWPFDAAEAKRRQAETARALGVPVEQDIDLGNGIKITMVLIPAGEFMMGSPEKPTTEELAKLYGGAAQWYERERPQHRVRVTKPFWIGKTEVTQAQWQAVMGANPSTTKGALNPVEQVSWNDCQTFLTRLNEKVARKGFRLPTEAEWEYACRTGAATQYHFGNGKEQLSDYAWWDGGTSGKTHAVGLKKPNVWRLHDMHGNVDEWCLDGYGNYASGTQTDPTGLTGSAERVFRGGAVASEPRGCRSASRLEIIPSCRSLLIGFRISRPLP